MVLHNIRGSQFMSTHDEGRHINCMLQIIRDMSEDGNKVNQRLFIQWVFKV